MMSATGTQGNKNISTESVTSLPHAVRPALRQTCIPTRLNSTVKQDCS